MPTLRLGLNADLRHDYTPAELAVSAAREIRFPLSYAHEKAHPGFYHRWIETLWGAHQLDVLPIVVREAFTPAAGARGRYLSRWRWWRRQLPPELDRIQLGNEADQPDSPSSWSMRAIDCSRLLRNGRAVFGPDVRLVGPGLVSGNPAYWAGVSAREVVDELAIHPYTQWPWTLETLVDLYRVFDQAIVLTELGVPRDWFAAESDRAEWHTGMILEAARLEVRAVDVFCYQREEPAFALVDEQDEVLESYAAFYGAATSPIPLGEPAPEPPDDPAGFFARLEAGVPDLIGLPYVWGGRDAIAQGGLDCAGFVLEAFWRQGINLCHVPVWPDGPGAERRFPDYDLGKWYTSAQRLWDNPNLERVDEPQPGDLVFFTRTYPTTDYVTHVAVVTRPGRMLGAQTPRAGYVLYDTGGFWPPRIAGYGRAM